MPAHDITTSYYLEAAVMTAPGAFAPLLADLPPGIAAVAEAAHGLLIHEHIAGSYGVTLTQEDRASVHIRPVAGLLERITAQDRRPLTVARTPASRVAGNCRHFTVLAVAALRAQGTPARARCGFGGYFGSGSFEDHWVCEYWNPAAQRWALAASRCSTGSPSSPTIPAPPSPTSPPPTPPTTASASPPPSTTPS